MFSIDGCSKDKMGESQQAKINLPQKTDSWIGLCNVANDKIEVYDIGISDWNTSVAKKISWSPSPNNGYSDAEVSAWGDPKDVRLRNCPGGGVWVTAGGKLATIVDQNTGNRRWALNVGATPNGVELLPNGNIVVAAKDGNWVRVYTSSQGADNYNFAQFNLTAPTTVLWDAQDNVIRVTGQTKLVALTVGGTDANPILSENTALTTTLPSSEGLDVSAYYGDPNKLFVSTHSGVYTYNKTTKIYAAISGAAFRIGINSCGNEPLGIIVQSGAGDSGSSFVDLYKNNGEFMRSQNIDGSLIYRTRIWKVEYESSEFSLVMLPDAQVYTSEYNGGVIGMFTAQTNWIKDHRESDNIVYVSQVGDISEFGDARTEDWINADKAMSILESVNPPIPYGVAVGNHEQLITEKPYVGLSDPFSPSAKFNEYFGKSRFNGRSYYGGSYVGTSCPSGNNDSHYDLFSAFGKDFIVIYIEFDSNNEDPGLNDWAYNLLGTYANRKAIVVSHYIITTTGEFTAQGKAIYQRLREKPNLFLMLCGHVTGEKYRQDIYNGSRVTTMLADYQGFTNGGDGYMQILKLSLTNNTISVKTYSPYRNEYKTDADSQFTIPLF